MTDEITPESARNYLQTLFANAGRLDKKYRTDEERSKYLSENGAQRFKRKALGLCGHTTIKSLDEIAQLLVDTNITSTTKEARQTVPKIVQASRCIDGINRGRSGYINFDEVKGRSGDVKYRITAWIAD